LHIWGFGFYQLIKSNFLQNILSKDKYFALATPELRQNPH
jgi:hypothetical protein